MARLLFILLLVGLLVGCSTSPPPSPTPTMTPSATTTPTPMVLLNTSAAVQWGTLPPVWTPTATLTPSRTFTPSPVPPTPTLPPPPTLQEVCDSLVIRYDFVDGTTFTRDQSIGFILGTLVTEVLPADSESPVPFVVRFLAQHESTDENLGADLAPGEIVGVQLPASELAENGTYRWTVSIVGEPFGEACVTTGTFVVTDSVTPQAVSGN